MKSLGGLVLGASLFLMGCTTPSPSPRFDFSHLDYALDYFEAPSEEGLVRISETAGAAHLKAHSDSTGYYDTDASRLDITRDLLTKDGSPDDELLGEVRGVLAYAKSHAGRQNECMDEAAYYLPQDRTRKTPLYVTWGYDIGVASTEGVSLNFVHPHFRETPAEIWYYCTHEAHHAGVYQYHPLPNLREINTIGEFKSLVRYLTYLEGTAVFAAYHLREEYGALQDDGDYRALLDEEHMDRISRRYNEIMETLDALPDDQPVTGLQWQLLDEMSGGERLWYRHGARMAGALYERNGAEEFRQLIIQGPEAFFTTYEKINADVR